MKALLTCSVAAFALLSGSVALAADKKAAEAEPYYTYKVENFAIEEPIGGKTGDAERGAQLVVDQKTGNCIACHLLPIEGAEFPGQIGPPLFAIGARYTPAQLRVRVVNQKIINPMTIMPGFYRNPKELNAVGKKYRGKTILTAQQVEDVVAWLASVK
ncbi:MAG: sulfur oxidation c-type cytochrome SoxX [Gammaproteobacteria bacterium]